MSSLREAQALSLLNAPLGKISSQILYFQKIIYTFRHKSEVPTSLINFIFCFTAEVPAIIKARNEWRYS